MLHIKMILRSWWRNKLNTTISLLSLITGLVCSTILILFVIREYRIANALGDTDNVYLIESNNPFNSQGNVRTILSGEYGYKIGSRYSDVEKYAIVAADDWKITNSQKKTWLAPVYRVTESFIDMFNIRVKLGDLKSTLNSVNEIAVTESFMQEYYGRSAVIGDRITALSGGNTTIGNVQIPPEEFDVTITAILDENTKTPFQYQALIRMKEGDLDQTNQKFTNHQRIAFIKLQPHVQIEQLQAKIKADSTYIDKETQLYFTPFNQVYFDDSNNGDLSWDDTFIKRRSGSLLIVGLSIALAVLVIAVFNYINITMTRARDRIKNISGQYIFGASKTALRWQTILDTLLIVLISFGISTLIINVLLKQFNAFMNSDISLSDIVYGWNLGVIAGILSLIVILSSLYILVKIDLNSPIENFKNPAGRKSTISNIMVITQIIVSVVMIVVSFNISRQMDYILEDLPGIKSIIEVSGGGADNIRKNFYNELKSLAFVEAHSYEEPSKGSAMSNNEGVVIGMSADESFIDLYGLKLIEGRNFVSTDSSDNVIANQTLIDTYKIGSPAAGKVFNYTKFSKFNIIGVVEDFMFEDAHKNIQPLIIRYSEFGKERQYSIYLRISGNQNSRIDQIRELWNTKYAGKGAIRIKPYTQIIRDRHSQEQRLATIVNLFMYISILLTALGLFGLAFYTVGQRKKEIALRKINGSTTTGVILRLCRTFCVWTAIAFVIATPLAYYFSSDWLSTFIYRIDISLWVFVATAGIVMLITFITVIFQSWRAASANPAKSIKSE